jgi:hypothetical protein
MRLKGAVGDLLGVKRVREEAEEGNAAGRPKRVSPQ